MENEPKKVTLGSLIKWAIIGMLLLSGIMFLFIKPIIGIMVIAIAGLFLPVTDKFIKEKFGVQLSKGAKIVIIIVLAIIGGSASNSLHEAREAGKFAKELSKTSQVQVFDIPKLITELTERKQINSEYEPYIGKLKSEFIPTKENLKLDPDMTSEITFEKDGKELLVEYDTESGMILNYFITDTSTGTKDLAGLYKIGNLEKKSDKYTVKEQASMKDPTIYTGLLVEPIRVEIFSDTQLKREAREVVLKTLKAPSTAKFSDYVHIKRLLNNCFIVDSSVDSQNGFGAMLNTSYSVNFCHLGVTETTDPYNSPIDLKEVKIDGKSVFKE